MIPSKHIYDVLHDSDCGATLLQCRRNKTRFDRLPQDTWFLKEKLLAKIEFSVFRSMLSPEEGKIHWEQPDWEGYIPLLIDAGFNVALDGCSMSSWGTFYDDGVCCGYSIPGAKYIDESLLLYKGKFILSFMDFETEKKLVHYSVYCDEIHLDKEYNLVLALKELYDGRSEIENVSQGFLGRRGEMHLPDHSPLRPWLDAGFSRERYVETTIQMNQIF